MREGAIAHVFVSQMPRTIESGKLYVSVPYATAVHMCPDCARKVVTPFAPGSWHLIFDGETVSISPSIWNVAHSCQAHYWIKRDRIVPAFERFDRSTRLWTTPVRETTVRSSKDVSWNRRLRRRLRRLADYSRG